MRLSDSHSSWTRSLTIVYASIINVRVYLFEALQSRSTDQQQAVVKNSTLYIDGGKESFINVNSNGTQEGDITVGISTPIHHNIPNAQHLSDHQMSISLWWI